MASSPAIIQGATTAAFPAANILAPVIRAEIIAELQSAGFNPTATYDDGTTPPQDFAGALANILVNVLVKYTQAMSIGTYAGMVVLSDVPATPDPTQPSVAHV